MANCPKCNAELADGAKFCTACGEKVEAAAQALPLSLLQLLRVRTSPLRASTLL